MKFGRALIVTDRDDWADRAIRACTRVGLVPDRIPWASAGRRRRLPVLVLADLDSDLPEKRRHLERWADRGWQPVTVICVRARGGTGELVEHLEELGYRRFHFVGRRVDWAAVESDVEEVWERPGWLVARVAQVLGSSEPALLDALWTALSLIPEVVTVERWARELGLSGRQRLDELFGELDLPAPKAVHDWTRLAKGKVLVERRGEIPKLDRLASELGYSSGRYLGKRTKQVAGLPPTSVFSLSLPEFFRLMRSQLNGPEEDAEEEDG